MPSISFVGYLAVRYYSFSFDCSSGGDYQTSLWTINMCYPNTTTQSYVYSNLKTFENDTFALTLTRYNSNNCTGPSKSSLASFSTNCTIGSFPYIYSYSSQFPQTDSGVMVA
jgi:hypothetical protein